MSAAETMDLKSVTATATSDNKSMTADVEHQVASDHHVLTIRGKTYTSFIDGLKALVDGFSKLYALSEKIPEYKMLSKWIQDSKTEIRIVTSTKHTCSSHTMDAYVVGTAINRLLHLTHQIIIFMMEQFKQPPKKFALWKDCPDEKCKSHYIEIQTAILGIVSLRGYADYIQQKLPEFVCLLPKEILESVTKNIPAVVVSDEQMERMGMMPIESPAYSIIGDCHPEFWCTEAERTNMRGYVGLKRVCSHLE